MAMESEVVERIYAHHLFDQWMAKQKGPTQKNYPPHHNIPIET